ncbi:hypothetical protein Jiend_28730 [Micromonospora endophytica]|nr:hypothetical protein Jiend_28730 [Micromonospora endophytica]
MAMPVTVTAPSSRRRDKELSITASVPFRSLLMAECDHPTQADHTDHEDQGEHHDGWINPCRDEVVVGIALVAQWEDAKAVVSVHFPVSGIERLTVNESAGFLAVEPTG